jgi:hypothetical protein
MPKHFYDFTRPASDYTSRSIASSRTSTHSEDRDRSIATSLTETEARSLNDDTRRPTTRDSSLEASTTEHYDDLL